MSLDYKKIGDTESEYLVNYFRNYKVFTCKAKKSSSHGRSMGGVIVCVNHTIAPFVKRIPEEFDFGIILSLDKHLFNIDKHVTIACLYIPPETSPVYERHISVLQELESIMIQKGLLDTEIIINGDLRTSVAKD